jgi:hypothetical protein
LDLADLPHLVAQPEGLALAEMPVLFIRSTRSQGKDHPFVSLVIDVAANAPDST